jgi:transcription elongation GreA/GreB family factor
VVEFKRAKSTGLLSLYSPYAALYQYGAALGRIVIYLDKTVIINQVTKQLKKELAFALVAANNAHKAATDDQSVAETQYDTLAIEQSYLAEGQSRRVDEIKYAIKRLQNIPLEALKPKLKINIGSVVQLEKDIDKQQWFFLAPVAGGYRCKLTLVNDTINVVVITPESPLGAGMMGKVLDDEVNIKIAEKRIADFITMVN